jgi:hypothetical protein
VTSGTLTQPLSGDGRRSAVVALTSALAGALALLAVIGLVRLALGGGAAADGPARATTFTAPGHAFALTVPKGWTALGGAELARVPNSPVAALKRADGRALVTVRRTAPVRGDLRATARGLTAELGRRLPGFRLVSARLGRVRAGGAFLYTFVRGASGTAQILALTSVRGVTYRIDSVVPGNAPDAARDAGAVVASFGP